MKTRNAVILAAAVVAGVALWFLFRPERLFLDRTVMESFPAMEEPAMEQPSMGMTSSASAESAAPLMPKAVWSGQFHSNAHQTSGLAAIYELSDGRRLLRLTSFKTSNGPDVRVYLVAARDVNDEAAARRAGFVDLGGLKGNVGDQNYEVPEGLDLGRYRAVSIWCRRFSVNFGAAPLVPSATHGSSTFPPSRPDR